MEPTGCVSRPVAFLTGTTQPVLLVIRAPEQRMAKFALSKSQAVCFILKEGVDLESKHEFTLRENHRVP